MSKRTLVPISHASMGLALLLCSGTIVSCSSQQERTTQQITATEHIEDPIRTLEARAELESLNPLPRADDTLIRRLLQDTTETLTPGTETYRKALLTADEIEINPIPGSYGFFLWEAAQPVTLFSDLVNHLVHEAIADSLKSFNDPVPQAAQLLPR